jgi:hypothetical protein
MAGRDYALEAWRLLDPEGSLIGSEEISQRLICVKPGKIKREFHFFCFREIAFFFRYGSMAPASASIDAHNPLLIK